MAGPPQSGHSSQASPLHSIATRLKAKGIPNFGQVSANLYRGAQPSAEGLEELKKLGVAVVVDLRGTASAREQSALNQLGMQYVSIPSHCQFPSDGPWAQFLKVMRQNQGKKVFVHCRLGDDRTGMAVAAYRISEQHWSADEAMQEMREFGFSGVHHALCPGLADYEKDFPRRLQQDQAFKALTPAAPAPR